jgi:hypothetical protein
VFTDVGPSRAARNVQAGIQRGSVRDSAGVDPAIASNLSGYSMGITARAVQFN